MKLSPETVSVLNSYKSINSNLRVIAGNKLETITTNGVFMASYKTQENLPDFSIHDLSEFLNVLSLYRDPDIEFDSKFLTIREGKRTTRYFYGDPSTFKRSPQSKEIVMPESEIKFNLSQDDLNVILKAAGALKFNNIVISKSGSDKLSVRTEADKTERNESSNQFSIELDCETDISSYDFNMIFDITYLRLVPGNYFVEVSSKKIAKFVNLGMPIHYFAAPNRDSTFG